jgi:hypothetical protein
MIKTAPETFIFPPEACPATLNSGRTICIASLSPVLLAEKLGRTLPETHALFNERARNRRSRQPNLIGEFVIRGLGEGGYDLRKTQVEAIKAHRDHLEAEGHLQGPLIYSGIRGRNFMLQGTIYGQESDESQLAAGRKNQFIGVSWERWRARPVGSPEDPFSQMFHGVESRPMAPIVAGFDSSALMPVTDVDECSKWRPVPGKSIEDTLSVVYHHLA